MSDGVEKMSKQCDHKSVGMIVERGGKFLIIERKKFPFGFACPDGHIDSDTTFEAAATRELFEEVGLKALKLNLVFEGRKENSCRREGGNWHYWKIYQAGVEGELKRSEDETKQAGWYTKDELQRLAQKTERYLKGEISEEDWQQSPGLEVVWYEFFQQLKMI